MAYSFFIQKRFFFTCFIALALPCEAMVPSAASGWTRSILVGYGATRADQTQHVRLADSPSPALVNHYVGSSTPYGATLFGIAVEKEMATAFANTIGMAGFEVDYLQNKAVNGVVEPMYNVSPNFDELKYAYDIRSLVLQATTRLTKQTLFRKFDGYVQAGVGAAINRLSDYHEYTPEDSSAAPMLSPFGNMDTLNPALSAGIGVMHDFAHDFKVSLGLRFFYTGRARLKKSPTQQTNASIVLSPISYQFFEVQLTA